MGYIGNPPAERYTSIDKQTITGDGTVGPYTLTHSVGNAQEIEVFVNNVRQEPAVAYTVAADQLTMTGTVDAADDFYVVFQGKAKMTAVHPSTFDLTAANGTFTGDLTVDTSTLYVDSTNNRVGIGTVSPNRALDGRSSQQIVGTFHSTGSAATISFVNSSTTDDDDDQIGTTSGNNMWFRTNGAERVRITSGGDVGIGTTNPLAKLHVNDTASAFYMGYGGNQDIYLQTTNGNILFTDYNAANERMRITSTGNVGIGATSVQSRLNLIGSSTSNFSASDAMYDKDHPGFIKIENQNDTTGVESGIVLRSKLNGAGVWSIYNKHSATYLGDLRFRARTGGTASQDLVTFTYDGNVGIGTTSPTADLHISYGSGSGLLIEDTTNSPSVKSVVTSGNTESYFGATSNHAVVFLQNNTERMQIDTSGNLKIDNGAELRVYRTGAGYAQAYAGISIDASENVIFKNSWANKQFSFTRDGNLLVGKTSVDYTTVGFEATPSSIFQANAMTADGKRALLLTRKTSDGDIAEFRKDSTAVGSIGTNGGRFYIKDDTYGGITFGSGGNSVLPAGTTGAFADNTTDLGSSTARFKDLYLSGGVYVGGTGSANYLDDYEEGTFTPTLKGQGTAGSSPSGSGYYTKVGDLVFAAIKFNFVTVSGAAGSIQVAGLPFTVSGTDTSATISITSNLNFSSSYIQGIQFSNSTTNMDTYENRSGSNPADWNITNTSNIIFVVSGCYKTT